MGKKYLMYTLNDTFYYEFVRDETEAMEKWSELEAEGATEIKFVEEE